VLGEHLAREAREARDDLDQAARRSREARSAVARISEGSRAVTKESEGAMLAAGELAPLLSGTAAVLADRASLLAHAIDAIGHSAQAAERAGEAAAAAAAAASRAEQSLAPAAPAAASFARAAGRIKARVTALGGLAERVRLLSLNAAVDAGRGEEGGRKLVRAVEEIQTIAGQASEGARALAAELAASVESAEAARDGVEKGGQEVRLVSERAAEVAASLVSIRDSAQIVRQEGGASLEAAPAGSALAEDAALSDRASSALEGLSRIGGRIAALSREIDGAAGEAAESCARIAQSVEPRTDGE
jgi:methyl-accepting chemotaxis protein